MAVCRALLATRPLGLATAADSVAGWCRDQNARHAIVTEAQRELFKPALT